MKKEGERESTWSILNMLSAKDYAGPLSSDEERYDDEHQRGLIARNVPNGQPLSDKRQLGQEGRKNVPVKAVRLRVNQSSLVRPPVDAAAAEQKTGESSAAGREAFEGRRVGGDGPKMSSRQPGIRKGRAARRVEVFASVPPPSPPGEDAAAAPGSGIASPQQAVYNYPDSPAESPLNPKIVGRLIEERRRDYGEKLQALHKRKYFKERKPELNQAGSAKDGRKRRRPADRLSPQTAKRVSERSAKEREAVLAHHAALRSEEAMKKLVEDKFNRRQQKQSVAERRARVSEMARIVRAQNKLRMEQARAAAAAMKEREANESGSDMSDDGQALGKENRRIIKTYDVESAFPPESTKARRLGTKHAPPKAPSTEAQAVPLPPRKPRVPRLSGRKPKESDDNSQRAGEHPSKPAALQTRKPPVPRLSAKATSQKKGGEGARAGGSSTATLEGNTGAAKKVKGEGKNTGDGAGERRYNSRRPIKKQKDKFRIQAFMREKRRLRRQKLKENAEKEELEDRQRKKKLKSLDAKFRKERERVKRQLQAEARSKAKKKRARRNLNRKMRSTASKLHTGSKTTLDELPHRAAMVATGSDLPFPLTEEFGANIVDQFQWQRVEPIRPDEEMEMLAENSHDAEEASPGNSRPGSSLSQREIDNSGDADFLNREALLNGLGTAKAFPQPTADYPPAMAPQPSSMEPAEEYEVARPPAEMETYVEPTAANDSGDGSDEPSFEERQRIVNRMDALRKATEQLSARISILSAQTTQPVQGVEEVSDEEILRTVAGNASSFESGLLMAQNIQGVKTELSLIREAEGRTSRHMKNLIQESQEFSEEAHQNRAQEDVATAESLLSEARQVELQGSRKVRTIVNEVASEASKQEKAFSRLPIPQKESVDAAPGTEENTNSSSVESRYSDDTDYENSGNEEFEQAEDALPGNQSLSSSLRVSEPKRKSTTLKTTGVKEDGLAPIAALESQEEQFENVLKDARDIFIRHSKVLEIDDEITPREIPRSSLSNGQTIPQVDLKLAAEAAAAVTAATNASREALERARQLEAESRAGIVSRAPRNESNYRQSGGTKKHTFSDFSRRNMDVDIDFKMSENAYSIVDSYSVLDIYAEETVQHQQHELAERFNRQRNGAIEPTDSREGSSDTDANNKPSATIAVQTGNYWDSLIAKTEDKGLAVLVVPEDDEVPMQHATASPGTGARDAPPSPPREQISTGEFFEESVQRLSPGSLSKKLLAEVDLLQELTESEKQLDAVVHARELELAQKETIELANQWNNQQQEAAVMAEILAAEQAHAAEMQLQTAQITLSLQAAHEEQVQSMNAHLEMIRKQTEEAKRRESGQQTEVQVLLDKGTAPSPSQAKGVDTAVGTSAIASPRNASAQLAESQFEYTADFENEESIGLSVRKEKLADRTSSVIEEEYGLIEDAIGDDDVVEDLGVTANESSIQESFKLSKNQQEESIAEEVHDSVAGNAVGEVSVQSVAEEYTYDQDEFESTEHEDNSDNKDEISEDEVVEGGEMNVQLSLQRSTKRLMKKVLKDMETRQKHEDALLEIREQAIQERAKINIEELKMRESELSPEDLSAEKDKISYTFKKNIAQVQRQRAALQVRHYREILKLRARHKSLERLALSSTDPEYSSAMDSEEGVDNRNASNRRVTKRPGKVVRKRSSSSTDKKFSDSDDIREELVQRQNSAESFVLDVREVNGATEVEEEDFGSNGGEEYELSIQEETIQEDSSVLKRSMSVQSRASDVYDEDFEDDFEEEDVLHDSIRMQKISQQLDSIQKLENQHQNSTKDLNEKELYEKEMELSARRQHAEQLLKEKQAIVDRARRRVSLENEEKRVNELLEKALQYNVKEELRKLESNAGAVATSTPSIASPVPTSNFDLKGTPASVSSPPQTANKQDKSPITEMELSEADEIEEESINEAMSMSSIGISQGEDSYGDETFEEGESIQKVSAATESINSESLPATESSTNMKESNSEILLVEAQPNLSPQITKSSSFDKTASDTRMDESSTSASIIDDEIDIESVEDEVDIGESWQRTMGQVDEDQNESTDEQVLIKSFNIVESAAEPEALSPSPGEGETSISNLEQSNGDESHAFLESFDQVEVPDTPQKLSPAPENTVKSDAKAPQESPAMLRLPESEEILSEVDQSLDMQSESEPETPKSNAERALLESFDQVESPRTPRHLSAINNSATAQLSEAVEEVATMENVEVSEVLSVNSKIISSVSPKRPALMESFDSVESAISPKRLSSPKVEGQTDSVAVPASPKNPSLDKTVSPDRKVALAEAVTNMIMRDLAAELSTSISSVKNKPVEEGGQDAGDSAVDSSSVQSESDDDSRSGGIFTETAVYEASPEAEGEEALSISDEVEDVYDFEDEDNLINMDSAENDSNALESQEAIEEKREEALLKSTQKWAKYAESYVEQLMGRVGIDRNAKRGKKSLLTEIIVDRIPHKDFEDYNIKMDVYVEIEKNSDNDEHTGIYNKLLFDVVNEALSEIADKTHNKDPPWIKQVTALRAASVYETLEYKFFKTLDDKLFRFDRLDNNPQAARRKASLNTDSGVQSTAPLTSLERMDLVLTYDAIQMEEDWKQDYERVEASVKMRIADEIFEELLYDTTWAVHQVKEE